MVIIFTDRRAFFSPTAIVVIAAIGLVAALLRLRLRHREQISELHRPVLVLNLLGIGLAVVALFSDVFGLTARVAQLTALGAVGSFAVSGAVILHRFRKPRAASK